jgi:hypothetical protein
MMIIRIAALTLLAFSLSTSAYAAPFTFSGGTAGAIPGANPNNDFIPGLFGGPQIGGYFGAQILFNVPAGSQLVIDFFGAEAGYVNRFKYAGNTVFTHSGGYNVASNLLSPLGTFSTTLGGSGTLPFRFTVNNNSGSVLNGSNPNDAGGRVAGPNFFASCNPYSGTAGSGGTSCNSVYLFLDDGGAGPDDDHDDFLVRVSVAAVPEPVSIVGGLVGLGLFVLRRTRSRA